MARHSIAPVRSDERALCHAVELGLAVSSADHPPQRPRWLRIPEYSYPPLAVSSADHPPQRRVSCNKRYGNNIFLLAASPENHPPRRLVFHWEHRTIKYLQYPQRIIHPRGERIDAQMRPLINKYSITIGG